MGASSVLVYRGTGTSEVACVQLLNALRSTLDSSKHDVRYVTPEAIIEGSELGSANLVAFGGGYTSGFESALGRTGLTNLRDFVLSGGSYLGMGAGGYFGCDFIEFDKGGPLEKFSERDLRFYPGIGIGPVYPGFKYMTNKGVNAAPITFNSTTGQRRSFHAFIDGGGMFKPSDPVKQGSNVSQIETLAQFDDLPGKPAAVIMTKVSQGLTVLSGVHLEYDTISVIDSDPDLERFRDTFSKSLDNQRSAFKEVLQLLNLHVVDP